MRLTDFKVGQTVVGQTGTTYKVDSIRIVVRLTTDYEHQTMEPCSIHVSDEPAAEGFKLIKGES